MIKFELENKFLQLSTEVEVSANSLAATSEVIIKAIAKEMKRKRSVFEPIFCSGKTYVLKNWFLEGWESWYRLVSIYRKIFATLLSKGSGSRPTR